MTRFAIDNDRITWVSMILIVIAGLFAYETLPQAEDPGFTVRTATVITYFPGASPERVENLVTDPIEEVVEEIPELDYVNSESRTGVSIVFVNILESYDEMRPIWDSLRRKVDGLRASLPDGLIGPIVNDEFGDVFGIVLTITGTPGFSYAELETVAEEVRDELLRLPDAAEVEIYGAQEERVFVEYDNARLAELDLSVQQLQQIMNSQNIVRPGGDVKVGPERIVLEPSGNFENIEDVRKTVIHLPGRTDLIYLGDIAEVTRGYVDPPESLVRGSGVRGLVLGVSLRDGGNVTTLGTDVANTMDVLETIYPWGIEFSRVADQPHRVRKKVDEFVANLLQAIGIVLIVMLLSLGLRTGFVVATLIPMAMLLTLAVMQVIGIGLDQMTLASLIIALGMLIDNAIVMSESIMVRMENGEKAIPAAVASGRELRVPLLTSSLTTAAAFLPFRLAESTSGEYTGVIFTVVAITLLSSWLLAMTMTPMLCARFLRVRSRGDADRSQKATYRLYRRFLKLALRMRWGTITLAILAFAGSLIAFRAIPVRFFPPSDRTFFTVQVELPAGTSIEATDEVVREIESFLADQRPSKDDEPGVTSWASFVGGGEPRYILNADVEQPNPSYAFLLVNTSSYPSVDDMIRRVQAFCAERFPDVTATVSPSGLGPPVEMPVQFRISGTRFDELFEIADRVKERLREVRGTRNVRDDWGRWTKKLRVEIDQPRARRAGITNLDIAVSLESLLSGVTTTELREEDEIIPIVLRSVEADREALGKLDSLNVYSQATGRSVPLQQVADIEMEWEPSKIMRRGGLRTMTVESDIVPSVTAAEVVSEMTPWLDEIAAEWPRSYRWEIGGEVESSSKANSSIGEQLPIVGLIIILLLVVQFNSVRKPAIILATIPLGLIGVVIGLFVFRSYFGFMTLLGMVSLSGIVINNAIVLLDRIQTEMDGGLDPPHAIVAAAEGRLRPILLTTMTTIGGLVPLYLGGGPMWEPMAVAIIAGLAFATLLTLVFVPVLFSLLYRVDVRQLEL